MLLHVVYTGLCVAHFELHKKKILLCGKVGGGVHVLGGGGFVWGFREGFGALLKGLTSVVVLRVEESIRPRDTTAQKTLWNKVFCFCLFVCFICTQKVF